MWMKVDINNHQSFPIQDPEKDQTLDELNVVAEHLVDVSKTDCEEYLVNVNFTPTVPHCSLATLIGKGMVQVKSIYKSQYIRTYSKKV